MTCSGTDAVRPMTCCTGAEGTVHVMITIGTGATVTSAVLLEATSSESSASESQRKEYLEEIFLHEDTGDVLIFVGGVI